MLDRRLAGHHVDMLFSQAFGISRTSRDDWFDPILLRDTPLFVDPFLIFRDRRAAWRAAHDELIGHFDICFQLIARGNLNSQSLAYRRALDLLRFKEPREFCLGYTQVGTGGSGAGIGLARAVGGAMEEAIERGLQDLRHFEELGVLREGIGPDRISDITLNVLKRRFIRYTQRIAARHGVPMDQHRVWASELDDQRQRWRAQVVSLPTNPIDGRAILLTPRRFVTDLPQLNDRDWWSYYETIRLRDDINYEVMTHVSKEQIVEAARANPDLVREWTQNREQLPGFPYDFDRDRAGAWLWFPVTNEYTRDNPLRLAPPQRVGEFIDVIEVVIDRFRHFVEERGGWRLLWNDDGSEKAEQAAQLTFYGIAQPYCETNNIVVDREVNLGKGAVDFRFSNGYQRRAVLEVKKLHNGHFWRNLENQLPSYMSSDRCRNGWFLAVQYRKDGTSEERRKRLPNHVLHLSRKLNLSLRHALVDAERQRSASNI